MAAATVTARRKTFRRCTMRARASSPKKWSTSPSAKSSRPSWCATKWRAAAPSSPPTSITAISSPWASASPSTARSTPTSATPPPPPNIDEELEKLHRSVHYGSDTVMDLSTGGDIPTIRKAIINASPVPIGTVPIYEALSRVRRAEDLTIELHARSDRRAGRAGRGLHDDPRRRAARISAAGAQPHHRHRQPRRRAAGRSG